MAQPTTTSPALTSDIGPNSETFIPPSIAPPQIHAGESYTHLTATPPHILANPTTECTLGVDEAGRGPVLGSMVYALAYLPTTHETPLLKTTHHFTDSKELTPAVRCDLMRTLCDPTTELAQTCGWGVRVMSARDISAGMLSARRSCNLNEQAMEATVGLIQGVLDQGVNVRELYIDTIGREETYQRRLERVFPALRVTVRKKADSLFPVVSAASVVAKVTRDVALEVSYEGVAGHGTWQVQEATPGWGSGYPSDAKCPAWMKRNMDPFFGWGPECRFSWGTAKEMLEAKGASVKIEWPEEVEDEAHDDMKLTSFYHTEGVEKDVWQERGELANWFGTPMTAEGI